MTVMGWLHYLGDHMAQSNPKQGLRERMLNMVTLHIIIIKLKWPLVELKLKLNQKASNGHSFISFHPPLTQIRIQIIKRRNMNTNTNAAATRRPLLVSSNDEARMLSNITSFATESSPHPTTSTNTTNSAVNTPRRSYRGGVSTNNSSNYGRSAVAPPPPTEKYKTELCKNFNKPGGCKFGNGCHYIHPGRSTDIMPKRPCSILTSTGYW